MDINSRFYGCESLGFPAVFNYDFSTNKSVRGINDRDFRWEDVAVESVYQLNEATLNGSFETTTFVPTNHTGVNFLSSGVVVSTAYTGWTATGSYNTYIGISGIYVNSGNLPGVLSSFQAHPLDGDKAIGMYCFNTGSPPILYTNPISTGEEGPIVPGGNHQLYLKAKLNYGSSAQLKSYIRGWSAGTIVAYYDALSGVWQLTAPTGSYTISSGISTIKHNFTCATFPAATPDHYDCYITNLTSGSFVTIDDVHIDAYYKKNAYIDYLVPSGYFIQVTPDLGWHNILSMFESSSDTINPHLRTLGPYAVDLASLTDNLDNSVTATIDYSDFINSTTSNFKRYLWRAIPVTPNGEVGAGGLPQKFNYVGDQVNTLFTVNPVVDDPTSTTKILTGNKGPTMTILVDGTTDNPNLSYPSATTWRLSINLSSASRVISLQGVDVGGATSSVRKITLTNVLYEQNSTALWNVFDEHGLVADVERLPNESNYSYAERIKSKHKNKAGPNFVGISNGAANELNISKITEAIVIEIDKNQYGTSKVNNILVEITSYSLRLSAESFVITERLFVDPIYNTVDLSYRPKDYPVYAELINVGKLDIKDFSIIEVVEDYLIKNQYKVDNKLAAGKYIDVTYTYYKEFLYKEYHTLFDLITAVNNFTDSTGQKVVKINISNKLSGGESCLGLYITQKTVTPSQSISIDWSPIYLKKVSDRGYRDYFISNNETIKETKYYEYIKELKDNIRIFWGSVETDKDRWDSNVNENLALDSIPTLFDPPLSKMLSVITGQETRLEAVNAWARGYKGFNSEYLKNVGLTQDLFQPGVGHTYDLVPSININTTSIDINTSLESNISETQNNNNILIFSGQR